MSPQERSALGNSLYDLIFVALSKHETRGYNAHQRAQTISEHTILEMERWIAQQTPATDAGAPGALTRLSHCRIRD